MLIVCKEDLKETDFSRLKDKLTALPFELRWGRRGNRLVLLVEHARPEQEELVPVLEDPAIEYVLKNPTEREITRLFTRRELLDLAIGSTGLLAAAAVFGPLALYLTAPASERSPRGVVPIGRADTIPVNSALTKVIDGQEFLVVRRGESSFHALSATCTHSHVCVVGWDPKRRQVVCPCHQGVFDLQGNVVSGPPPRPLSRREVVVRDGVLYMRRSPS